MKKTLLAFFAVSIGGILMSSLSGDSDAHSNSAGAPGPGTCTACHGSTVNTSSDVSLDIYETGTKDIVTSYTAGKTYGITVGMKRTGITKVGFALSSNIGTIATVGGATRSQIISRYATHTSSGTAVSDGEASWDLKWTAPATGSTNATFQLYINNTNANNNSDPGDQVFGKSVSLTKLATGIETLLDDEGVHLFPQPSSGKVSLQYSLKTNAAVKVSVFDLTGRKVMETAAAAEAAGSRTTAVDISALRSGIYLIQLNVNGETLTKKMMVN